LESGIGQIEGIKIAEICREGFGNFICFTWKFIANEGQRGIMKRR
jgi:hypothetical protein